MQIGQINVPEPLIEAQRNGALVVFAGAGVSMPPPSDYPNFEQLAEEIAAGSALTREDHETLERFLGRLENRGVRVHRLARDRLTNPSSRPNRLHYDLLRLFDSESDVRLVTTNFDSHFTTAARELFDDEVSIFDAPALPLGDRFEGIVYLHGSVERDPEQLVLTDKDFGRAYLTEG
jgi:NAD-dependent SIR2 family protein deacetylase